MDIKELKTKSDRVYPEIVINAPNPAEAAVLQSDYAGKQRGRRRSSRKNRNHRNAPPRYSRHYNSTSRRKSRHRSGQLLVDGSQRQLRRQSQRNAFGQHKSGASRNSELSPHDSQAYKPIDNRNSRVHNSGRRGAHSDVRRAVEVS